jgi:MSHA biogenesis protein MshP
MLAVFMIVTLAAIGLYLVTISTGQIEAATQDEQSARAHQAARAGIEWAAFQLLRNPTSTFASTCPIDPAKISQTLTTLGQGLPPGQGLSGFFSTVTCQRFGPDETEGTQTVRVYRVVSTGCNSNPCPASGVIGPTYVERQLQLTITN